MAPSKPVQTGLEPVWRYPKPKPNRNRNRTEPLINWFGGSKPVRTELFTPVPATPVFHVDYVQDIEDIAPTCSEQHHSKVVPGKVDDEKISPYFAFCPHEVIPPTVQQTTQLAKSTIHFPIRRHLKSLFQILRHKR